MDGMPAGYFATKQADQNLQTGLLQQQLLGEQIGDYAALGRERDTRTQQMRQQMAIEAKNFEAAQQKQALMRQLWASGQPGDAQSGTRQPPETQSHASQDPIGALQAQIEQRQKYATNLASAGLFDESAAVLKGVTEEFHKLGQIRAEQALRRERTATAAEKEQGQINQILTGVTDESSFNRAKLMILSQNPNQGLPPWMGLPFAQAKPYIDQYAKDSKEAVDKTRVRSEIEKNKAVEVEQKALARLNAARAQLEELELRVQRDRVAAAEKAGELPDSTKRASKKPGAAGGGKPISAVERLNADQMIRAGNEIFTGFDEILKLGPTGMGAFSDVAYTKDPTFIGGVKKWLGNEITKDEEHMYAARLAGVNVAAAIVASGGRAPRVSQMEAEQAAIASLKGQSRRVYFDKIHQATLKAIRGIEITRAGDDEQANNLNLIMERLKAVEKQTADALKITSNFAGGPAPKSVPASATPAPIPALPPGFTLDK